MVQQMKYRIMPLSLEQDSEWGIDNSVSLSADK